MELYQVPLFNIQQNVISKISTTAGVLTLQFLLLISFFELVLGQKNEVLLPGFCLLNIPLTLVLLILTLRGIRIKKALLLFWFLGLLPYVIFVMPLLLRNLFSTDEVMHPIRLFIQFSCFFISAGCLLREVYMQFIRRQRNSAV